LQVKEGLKKQLRAIRALLLEHQDITMPAFAWPEEVQLRNTQHPLLLCECISFSFSQEPTLFSEHSMIPTNLLCAATLNDVKIMLEEQDPGSLIIEKSRTTAKQACVAFCILHAVM
jgi:hypothetical protein